MCRPPSFLLPSPQSGRRATPLLGDPPQSQHIPLGRPSGRKWCGERTVPWGSLPPSLLTRPPTKLLSWSLPCPLPPSSTWAAQAPWGGRASPPTAPCRARLRPRPPVPVRATQPRAAHPTSGPQGIRASWVDPHHVPKRPDRKAAVPGSLCRPGACSLAEGSGSRETESVSRKPSSWGLCLQVLLSQVSLGSQSLDRGLSPSAHSKVQNQA